MTVNKEDTATEADTIPPTEIIYYTFEGNFELECEAEILSCEFVDNENENDKKGIGSGEEGPHRIRRRRRQVQIVLNRTVLHAQGGGQPTDTGSLRLLGSGGDDGDNNNGTTTVAAEIVITVTKVVMDRSTGIATHIGTLNDDDDNDNGTNNNINTGQSLSSWTGKKVRISVDGENRRILSECHTAGHLVDTAMADCDTGMLPTKAYHFLEGPYVEYKGKIAAGDRDALLEKLQNSFRDLVRADIATEIANIPRPEAETICNESTGVEDYFKLRQTFREDAEVRIVTVAGKSVPCAGTHVRSTGELRKDRNWGITGLRCKKGVVRVKYGQDCNP